MATRHSIERRTEKAFSAYLQANLGGSAADDLPITLSFEGPAEGEEDTGEELESEGIRITSPQYQEYPLDSGDGNVELDVAIATIVGATSADEHEERVGAVLDLIYNTELIANMATAAAAAGVTMWRCMQVTKGIRTRERRGSQRITTQRLTLLVMPS